MKSIIVARILSINKRYFFLKDLFKRELVMCIICIGDFHGL